MALFAEGQTLTIKGDDYILERCLHSLQACFVFEARRAIGGEKLALKLQNGSAKVGGGNFQLLQESQYLRATQYIKNVPRVVFPVCRLVENNSDELFGWWVIGMELLESPLDHTLKNGPLKTQLWCVLARDMVSVMEKFQEHEGKGVAHLDVKPANILFRPSEREYVLADLGVMQVSTSVKGRRFTGTAEYASCNAHDKYSGGYSSLDDWESLFYVLHEAYEGSLPWINKGKAKKLTHKAYAAAKNELLEEYANKDVGKSKATLAVDVLATMAKALFDSDSNTIPKDTFQTIREILARVKIGSNVHPEAHKTKAARSPSPKSRKMKTKASPQDQSKPKRSTKAMKKGTGEESPAVDSKSPRKSSQKNSPRKEDQEEHAPKVGLFGVMIAAMGLVAAFVTPYSAAAELEE